jgi:hypothetical protein
MLQEEIRSIFVILGFTESNYIHSIYNKNIFNYNYLLLANYDEII